MYGGAFDPPHRGHYGCVEAAHHLYPTAKILIVPGLAPAGARAAHKVPAATFAQRLQMCALNFSDLLSESPSTSRIELSTLEEMLPVPNYTVKTLEKIVSLSHPDELYLLVGGDQLKSFHSWHQPHKILELASLIIVERQELNTPQIDLAAAVRLLVTELGLSVSWLSDDRCAYQVAGQTRSVDLVRTRIPEAASRVIKDLTSHHSQIPDSWLTPTVRQYIKDLNLYL